MLTKYLFNIIFVLTKVKIVINKFLLVYKYSRPLKYARGILELILFIETIDLYQYRER